jgi:threonine synthase
VLETAHPAKFLDTVETALKQKIEIPERLEKLSDKQKVATALSNDYEDFKGYLLGRV